ncbi:sphingolipid delta(4)-desaturase/C4-monooxygenase DES2-like [Amphibalanus amphitrite]|uniref:sphingolipid delta(4)-desaturase/C4-monooxygenase DES2-like n=1 Tax=Amphibalanus amphitrite TaxID=1232801 RepID=UPI001C9230D6|nr:sphingolipid delta(4)-desaturase/C4-monooxygenase DES2-like [Amphibalanus amphitrite]
MSNEAPVHPQVRALMGAEPRLALASAAVVAAQLYVGYLLRRCCWPAVVAAAYLVGGSLWLLQFTLQHDAQHRNVFGPRWPRLNDALAWVLGAPALVPYRFGRRRKHLDHHRHLGEPGRDADRPSEGQVALSRRRAGRLLLLVTAPLASRARQLRRPADAAQSALLVTGALLLGGPRTAAYLALGPLLGRMLHPFGAALLCSHSYGPGNQVVTYSYRGPLNWLFLNTGYHIEHHDFPNVPCCRLAAVTRAAPEFYAGLPHVDSWFTCMINYVTGADRDLTTRHDT